jgi:outer membrane receptor protein involved in Fe transport
VLEILPKGCTKKLHFILFCLLLTELYAGTTGKITGTVVDEGTGAALPGANIIVDGTTMGAASAFDGYYSILNLPPGVYAITARMMGYSPLRLTDVHVSIDLTTQVDFELAPTVLEAGEEVTVTAFREVVQKDLTSTLFTVGADMIADMPVEDFAGVLELQAGMVKGHMRGGRTGEIAYLIDGVSVTDAYSGDKSVEIENMAIQELQVVSGTFNAEYGQAMSGLVNIVTKDGGRELSGSLDIYSGDYISRSSTVFLNLDDLNPSNILDVQANLNGPVPLFNDRLAFFASGRYSLNEGWIYGQRIYNPTDNLNPLDLVDYTGATGDSAFVSLNPQMKVSLQSKLTLKITDVMKLRIGVVFEKKEFQSYTNDDYSSTHQFRFNPDGIYRRFADNNNFNLTLNHALSANTFYDLSLTQFSTDQRFFVYENPLDTRYVNPKVFSFTDAGFYTGGTEMWHFYRSTKTSVAKLDLTSQITRVHKIKLGMEGRLPILELHEFEIVPKQDDAGIRIEPFEPDTLSIDSYNHNRYKHNPIEFSTYIQDKMEFIDMIINLGVRFDFFEPDGKVPVNLFDPHNDNALENAYRDAKSKTQISPRFGIAYPISEKGVIHFSYGHFFQIPTFEYLYATPEFEVTPGGLTTRMGNADLNPQKTVIYEIGLQQEIIPGLGLDVTAYYKDIRELLGTDIQKTFDQKKYARYINRDYGNVRGITFALDLSPSDNLSTSIDYTYQVAEGNASDPDAAYYDNRSDPPRESEKQVVPLDWDQTHTLNMVVTYAIADNWGFSILGKIGSGLPYTPAFGYQRTGFENSERKSAQYNFDLKVHKTLSIARQTVRVFLKVYNIFDRRNEEDVYSDTGRAGYTLVESRLDENYLNKDNFYSRPDFYSEPRQIRMGLSYRF